MELAVALGDAVVPPEIQQAMHAEQADRQILFADVRGSWTSRRLFMRGFVAEETKRVRTADGPASHILFAQSTHSRRQRFVEACWPNLAINDQLR